MRFTLAAGVVAASLLSACAGQPTVDVAVITPKVVERGRAAQTAYRKGDLARAATLFEQARQEALRVEDSEGVAVMSVNLARVRRESGESRRALALLDAVSPWHRGHASARSRGEIELLGAVLQADLGQGTIALERLKSLRAGCGNDCPVAIGVDSLEARLLLETGKPAQAASMATSAIGRYGGQTASTELANLHRVLGESRLALGEPVLAREALESALRMDKELKQPARIAQSLELLARAAAASGDGAARMAYQARLLDIQQARGQVSTGEGRAQ